MNRNFADAVLDELEHTPDATVFFHDYLYLAPRMVRDARPETTLQQFVHPVAAGGLLARAAARRRQEIHLGLLANDVVGFLRPLAPGFLRSCEDFVALPPDYEQGTLELDGRTVRVNANPISVDTAGSTSSLRAPRCSRPSDGSSSNGPRSSCCA